jgi:HAD superfamily hydrolase (TIGR01509 family)
MLRAVLFDFGDTLINFEPLDTRAVFRVSARNTYDYLHDRGHVLPSFERYCRSQFSAVRWRYLWAKLRGREFNSLDLLRRYIEQLSRSTPNGAIELEELAWLWYAPMTRHSTVEEGAAQMLSRLSGQGLQLGLVSNTFVPGPVLDRHLALHGLLDFFPVRIYSSEVGFRKPNPRIFRAALERMGVGPDEALFVGDLVKTDIVGARRVGMRTVLKQPWGRAGAAHPVADMVIRRLSELPDAIAALRRGADEAAEEPPEVEPAPGY